MNYKIVKLNFICFFSFIFIKILTMKHFITISFFLFSIVTFSQNNGNYVIVIDNDSVFINLDETKNYKSKTGEELKVQLVQPSILTYSDDMISFNYESSLNVSNTVLEEGIEQCLVMKSTGNGFLIQKYSTINPIDLVSLVLNELTKESVNYGYKRTDKKFKKTLVSGETIEGLKVTLKYQDEKQEYTVATYGEKDSGILVLTMFLNNDYNDMEIIDLLFNTLQLKK